MLYYIRDEKNRLLGFKYNEDLYFYQKNNQEDIIGIYDSNYHLIATYVYDSWGKILSIKDSSGNEITDSSHIAIINPFRYRSYYYDEETKLYYLNARYYNPEWGRFLNADSIIYTMNNIGYNLFCYVENNPINNKDPNGNVAIPIIGCVLGLEFPSSKAQITGTAIGVNNVSNPKSVVPHIRKSENKNKLPNKSFPNTTLTAPNGNKRVYGPDGIPVKDIDYSHPWHHPELNNPHIHDWDWSKKKARQLPRNPKEGELEEKIIASFGVGYLIYRGIRIIGAFTPGFWWTIPMDILMP